MYNYYSLRIWAVNPHALDMPFPRELLYVKCPRSCVHCDAKATGHANNIPAGLEIRAHKVVLAQRVGYFSILSIIILSSPLTGRHQKLPLMEISQHFGGTVLAVANCQSA